MGDEAMRAAMGAAMTGFAGVVAGLDLEDWDLPTPCTGWSVLDVVDHVLAGERFTVAVMGGASLDDGIRATVGIDPNNGNVLGQLTEAAGAALKSFDGSLDRTIEHRVGLISGRRMLGFRIIDQLGHTYDVATASGQGVDLDSQALAVGLEIVQAERETLERSPNFATTPASRVETGDPLATFLRAIGR